MMPQMGHDVESFIGCKLPLELDQDSFETELVNWMDSDLAEYFLPTEEDLGSNPADS